MYKPWLAHPLRAGSEDELGDWTTRPDRGRRLQLVSAPCVHDNTVGACRSVPLCVTMCRCLEPGAWSLILLAGTPLQARAPPLDRSSEERRWLVAGWPQPGSEAAEGSSGRDPGGLSMHSRCAGGARSCVRAVRLGPRRDSRNPVTPRNSVAPPRPQPLSAMLCSYHVPRRPACEEPASTWLGGAHGGCVEVRGWAAVGSAALGEASSC